MFGILVYQYSSSPFCPGITINKCCINGDGLIIKREKHLQQKQLNQKMNQHAEVIQLQNQQSQDNLKKLYLKLQNVENVSNFFFHTFQCQSLTVRHSAWTVLRTINNAKRRSKQRRLKCFGSKFLSLLHVLLDDERTNIYFICFTNLRGDLFFKFERILLCKSTRNENVSKIGKQSTQRELVFCSKLF